MTYYVVKPSFCNVSCAFSHCHTNLAYTSLVIGFNAFIK